ncbi:stage II sporulation protein P [Bacillus sp. DTU_2020_1000418_1_SI_GHA_SEK_038]|uniref:stage II sporulation protein P n=1 Tax=Bacillus sp. DTU_2020_1000418_1_SI_GHA_SEK_038 TaxID=3077585 RepID=UPI0028ECB740|nr:stage II sporulation protein P [Bacillus sp. DTU_2020_1000418_1_SI_GHA_SEK_038]WNS74883.1 stage II sporulation protein P [Bacillus sp. DTU_2020_1000418_1_SI_GHA_SEK_038]
MRTKSAAHTLIVYFHGWLLSILSVFILAGVLTSPPAAFTSEHMNSLLKNIKADQLFIYLLKSENHYFYPNDPGLSFSNLSESTFRLATNIKPTDIRTFLGRELPGYSIFDTGIEVAGEGTDYTNLPFESAPPIDFLLKEKEIASENLAGEDTSDNTAAPPPLDGKKSVFIYHSHSWESFTPLLKGVNHPDEAVSSNERVNVIAVGKRLSEKLALKGIGVEHDKTNMASLLNQKDWNYNQSYLLSREVAKTAMASNKNLNFLIDIHRDSQRRELTTKEINGKKYARMFFVVGKEHKNYQKNLQLATELHHRLEAKFPGISRGVFKKGKSEGNGIYNQDLSERALLIEFGGVDNDLIELYHSIDAFSDVFSEFYWEAEMVHGEGS